MTTILTVAQTLPPGDAQTFHQAGSVSAATPQILPHARRDLGKSYPEYRFDPTRNSTFRTNSKNLSDNLPYRKNPCFLMMIIGLDDRDHYDFDPKGSIVLCAANPRWHRVSERCTVQERVFTYSSVTTMVRSTRILSERESRQLRDSSEIPGLLRGAIAMQPPMAHKVPCAGAPAIQCTSRAGATGTRSRHPLR